MGVRAIPFILVLGFIPEAFGESLFQSAQLSTAPVQMVGDEFDPALLENLPAPASDLPSSALVARIEKDQWRGSLSGITKSARAVFRKQEGWEKFWKLAIQPYSPRYPATPTVDFSKEMVVGTFLGEKSDPSYQTE